MEYLPLKVNGEDFEARPDNTVLYTFIGEAAMYDHCFLITKETQKAASGAYVFKLLAREAFDYISGHIKKNHYPQHLNMLDAPQCDRDAFDTEAFRDLTRADGVPEGWATDGGNEP